MAQIVKPAQIIHVRSLEPVNGPGGCGDMPLHAGQMRELIVLG